MAASISGVVALNCHVVMLSTESPESGSEDETTPTLVPTEDHSAISVLLREISVGASLTFVTDMVFKESKVFPLPSSARIVT